VPASTASQFSRELEDIKPKGGLDTCKPKRRAEHRSEVSHVLDTIPEIQNLDVDLEVVPLVSVRVGHLPVYTIFRCKRLIMLVISSQKFNDDQEAFHFPSILLLKRATNYRLVAG